jgi:hypothetical protein
VENEEFSDTEIQGWGLSVLNRGKEGQERKCASGRGRAGKGGKRTSRFGK